MKMNVSGRHMKIHLTQELSILILYKCRVVTLYNRRHVINSWSNLPGEIVNVL